MRILTTLRSQFVAVVAAAVILSNLAVVGIIEVAREGELQGQRVAAAVDRIAAMFDYVTTIPDEQRDSAVRALNGNVFRYSLGDMPIVDDSPMSDEEKGIATELVKDERNRKLGAVRVQVTQPKTFSESPLIEIAQEISPGQWVDAHFERQVAPRAPDIVIAAALATILTGAAAAWLAGQVSRPLTALAYAADEVARGSTAPRLRPRGPDDIRRASEAFNEMSDRVTRTLASQRELLSAVGHDLRTPIAAMRITAEFVDDPETRDRLSRNLDELQSLTEAVLSAARAGPGEEKRRVDLAALIESVCDDLIELGLPIDVDIQGSSPCMCRPNEIRRAVRNLIENAARYGGSARVSLKGEPGFFVATVDDTGAGIPEERLEDVFEPFVRLDNSRSKATGGSGLGLTLTRSIAREHGGDVTLENRKSGNRIAGLRASLRLPRESARAKGETAAAVAPEAVDS